MIRAKTKRLLLRDITPDDAAFQLKLLNDPGWLKYIGDRGVRTQDQARQYIEEKIIKQYVEKGFGMYLVAIRKEDEEQEIIGHCGLVKRAGLEQVDIGFAFLEGFCRQGYGTEAAMAVKAMAAKEFDLAQLCAITTVENIPSQKLLEKIGFRYMDTREIEGIEGVSRYYELGPPADLLQRGI